MKKSININVNKDDQNINDFLFCWSEFNERPNKITIYNSFDFVSFQECISKFGIVSYTIHSEIYPSISEFLENTKYLSEINDKIYISYVIYDSRSEESFVGDVSFYFKSDSKERVDEIINQLESLIEVEELASDASNFFSLVLDNTGFDILPINYLGADYDNIELYFNDDVLKSVKKLTKKINENSKGLSIIYGEKGVGKSVLMSYMSQLIDKKVIFIPSTLVETAINSSDFRNFLIKHKNSLILIDDCESFNTDLYLKTNNFIKNLIQLVDGIDSDNFSSQISLLFNISEINEIDETLLESNHLQDVLLVDELEIEKAKELLNHLKKNKKVKTRLKLIDILQKKNKFEKIKSIGFE